MAKVGVEIIGMAGLRQRIEQAIRAHAGQIEKTLSEIGDVGVRESALRAPVDEGILTESIEKTLGRDEDGPAVAIRIPNNSPAAPYALRMHEDEYQLGPKSEQKQNKSGVEVGRKYITRGIEAGKPQFEDIIRENLKV